MTTLQQHIDALDRMVENGTSVAQLRSQIAFIGREVAALEADNARLVENKAQLQEAHTKLQQAQLARDREGADDVQFHLTMEFRCGKRMGGGWMPFCPKCHMPLVGQQNPVNGRYLGCCSACCGWGPVILPADLQQVINEFSRDRNA